MKKIPHWRESHTRLQGAFSNEWDIEDNYNQIISILERYELQIEYKHFISNYCLTSSNENIRGRIYKVKFNSVF